MQILKKKQGNILFDGFFAILLPLIAAILILSFTYTIYYYFNLEIQALPSDIGDNETRQIIADMGNNFLFLDKLIPFLFVFLWGAVIMNSILVNPDHPIFFLVSLVTLFILTLVSILVTDFSTAIFTDSLIFPITQGLSNSYFFVNNFHYISFFIMLGSIVFFYGRGRFGTGGGLEGLQ